jgi:NADH:ubiquinone oxidoreductase subunit E
MQTNQSPKSNEQIFNDLIREIQAPAQQTETTREKITRLFWRESEDIKAIAKQLSLPAAYVRKVVNDYLAW